MHPTRDSNAAAIIWRSDLTRIPVIKLLWASTIAMDCRYWINDTIWYNLSQVNWSTDLSTSHKAPVSASRPPTSMLNDKNVNASIFQDEMNHPSLQFLSLTTHHVWGPLVSACGENAADREARFIWLPLRLHKAMLWTFVCRSLKEKCGTNLTILGTASQSGSQKTGNSQKIHSKLKISH